VHPFHTILRKDMSKVHQRYQFTLVDGGVQVTLRATGGGMNNTALAQEVIPLTEDNGWPSAGIEAFINKTNLRRPVDPMGIKLGRGE